MPTIACLAALAVAGVFVAGGGCRGNQGEEIKTGLDFKPEAVISPEATLKVASAPEVSVVVKSTVQGTRVSVDLVAYDQVFEHEAYDNTAEAFSLVDAASEIYSPPLTLLKFPMHVGDTWEWQGTMDSGTKHAAKAKITTSSRTLTVKTGSYEAVKVDVTLTFKSGGPKPATRDLTFWFAPGKGIIKRTFGESTREP